MAANKLTRPGEKLRKRILVVDDHPVMRAGLVKVINHESDLIVCGEAENANRALEAVKNLEPDLALVDITLPGKSGLELIKDLKVLYPRLVMLAISMHDESLYAERALRAGASGYITKQQPPEELIKAVRLVLAERLYVSEQVSQKIVKQFSGRHDTVPTSPLEMLTDREFEVFQLVGDGKSPQDIARQLHLSPKTVAVHSRNVRQKLELKNNAQLIRFAVRWEDVRNLAPD